MAKINLWQDDYRLPLMQQLDAFAQKLKDYYQ
jgi:hypothetical protein